MLHQHTILLTRPDTTTFVVPPVAEGDCVEVFVLVLAKRSGTYEIRVTSSGDVRGVRLRIIMRGISKGGGRIRALGALAIPSGAVGVDASLDMRFLTLDSTSYVEAIPQLEVCSSEAMAHHGLVVSSVDPQSLLYLASRGLSTQEARRLIVRGFFENSIATIQDTVFCATARRALSRLWR